MYVYIYICTYVHIYIGSSCLGSVATVAGLPRPGSLPGFPPSTLGRPAISLPALVVRRCPRCGRGRDNPGYPDYSEIILGISRVSDHAGHRYIQQVLSR